MKKKETTNEDLLKKISELQEQLQENKYVVPYIPHIQQFPEHNHCICQHCHPNQLRDNYPWVQYSISSGDNLTATGNIPPPANYQCGRIGGEYAVK